MTHYTIQQQYIKNLHDDFVECIGKLLCFYDLLMAMPQATEEDKRVLGIYKAFCQGKAVMDIERDLAEGIVGKSTLDKIEKLCKDFWNLALDSFPISPMTKVFLKQLAYVKIEQDKEMEMIRLRTLGMIEG